MYATKQDMIDRFGEREMIERTDRVEPYTDAIVDSVLDGALSDAAAEIDSYLAVRYDLPLASTPKVLVKIACDIARKNLYTDRPLDEVTENYKDARRWLENVSKGVTELDVDGAEPAGDTTGAPEIAGPAPKFTSDTMKGY